MSNDIIDPQDLAALLEGKLSEAKRAELMEKLARSPEGLELYAEAAAIQRDLEGTEPTFAAAASKTAEVLRREPGRAFRWRTWVPLAAAALIMLVLVPRVVRRAPTSGLFTDGAALRAVQGAPSLALALGDDWVEPPWSNVRGSANRFAPPQLAFRAGARVADFALALDDGDAVALARANAEISSLLGSVDGSAPFVARFQALRETAPPAAETRERLNDAIADLRVLLATTWFDFGLWIEQARLAARAGDTRFFAAGGDAAAELRRLIAALQDEAPPLTQPVRDGLEALQSAIAAGITTSQLPQLRTRIDALIMQSAG